MNWETFESEIKILSQKINYKPIQQNLKNQAKKQNYIA